MNVSFNVVADLYINPCCNNFRSAGIGPNLGNLDRSYGFISTHSGRDLVATSLIGFVAPKLKKPSYFFATIQRNSFSPASQC